MNEKGEAASQSLSDEELDRKIEAIAKQRADAQAKVAKQTKLRRLEDTQAIAALEAQYGASHVATREVPFISPDLPILVAVRTPTPAMVKSYRAGVEPNEEGDRDIYTPAEDLAIQCLIYPDRDTFLKMREHRYGIGTQMGLVALNLGTAHEERRGKA